MDSNRDLKRSPDKPPRRENEPPPTEEMLANLEEYTNSQREFLAALRKQLFH